MIPTEPALSVARAALATFARKASSDQSDIDMVMRSLVEHDDWYVSVEYAERVWGMTDFDHMVVFQPAASTATLTVFTDRESARHADGQPLGAYAGGIRGIDLFAALDATVGAFYVNPYSPRDCQWYIDPRGFDIAQAWAAAVAVEKALDAWRGGSPPVAELRGARIYRLLVTQSDNALAQISLPDVEGQLAIAFTAPDRCEEFLSGLTPGQRRQAGFVAVDGPQLFRMMRTVGAAGLVVNGGSDHQAVLLRADIEAVALAEARAG